MFKQSKGITLVALVITIIVLLILAGVSINFIFGSEGIFTKTQTAVDKYKNAQNYEQEMINGVTNYITSEYLTGNRTEPSSTLFGINGTQGEGTESNPYIITNSKQLLILSFLVEWGDSFEGKFLKLGANISLDDICGESLSKSWKPIGQNLRPFSGTFDGAGFTISKIYIDNNERNQGLFGSISGATIKNLKVEDSYIKGEVNIGGIVGTVAKSNNNSNMINCSFNGTVYGNLYNIGAFIGSNGGNITIDNCRNFGNITGNNVGGVCGICCGENIEIKNCINLGQISGDYVGGICGSVSTWESNCNTKISNCYSAGIISGTSNVGPIVGDFSTRSGYSYTSDMSIDANTCYLNTLRKDNNYSTKDNSQAKIQAEMSSLLSAKGITWPEE